jgi:hypothetical protein
MRQGRGEREKKSPQFKNKYADFLNGFVKQIGTIFITNITS